MKRERGNILFLILLAVILFAALSYAVTSSLRGGGRNASKESNDLLAAQIVQFGAAVETAVQRMKLTNNTQDTQFEWQTPAYLTMGGVQQYVSGLNSNDRGAMDNIFDPSGGGVSPMTFEKAADASGLGTGPLRPGHASLKQFAVQNVGTSAPELLLVVERLNTDVCKTINDNVGVTNTGGNVPTDVVGNEIYAGAFNSVVVADASELVGKTEFCFDDTAPSVNNPGRNDNFYFRVLIAR